MFQTSVLDKRSYAWLASRALSISRRLSGPGTSASLSLLAQTSDRVRQPRNCGVAREGLQRGGSLDELNQQAGAALQFFLDGSAVCCWLDHNQFGPVPKMESCRRLTTPTLASLVRSMNIHMQAAAFGP
ncbi:hypothetical protein BRADI_2g51755v3 [Brachypodium distachyon]|uniref:Uncharacterized protein n=1 Tax=Brachypodium distachyon TaxID=15368 RepID=A0A2K2DFA6_BRADI|nr:hypothetical protein BRADI_2g51755v3 [Brachypodium distachyon]